MGHGRREAHWYSLAHELAKTGRYRNVSEVEAALRSKEPDASLPSPKLLRGLVDGACFRARRARGWDT